MIFLIVLFTVLFLSACRRSEQETFGEDSEQAVTKWNEAETEGLTHMEENNPEDRSEIPSDEQDHTQNPKGKDSKEESALTVPPAMTDAVKSATWMMGIMVNLENCKRVSADLPETFRMQEDTIRATVDVANGVEGYAGCSLLVLMDGAPAVFTIEGDRYESYHMDLSGYRRLDIELDAAFDLNIGRLDFYLLNENGPESVSFTYCIEQDEAPMIPEKLHETVPSREGVVDHFRGSSISSWLWDSEDHIFDDMNVGPERIDYHPGEDLIFEATAGEAGYYRTVMICGGRIADATENGERIEYIDWYGSADNADMLHFTIQINEMLQEEETFRQITTPLDREKINRYFQCLYSTRLIRAE